MLKSQLGAGGTGPLSVVHAGLQFWERSLFGRKLGEADGGNLGVAGAVGLHFMNGCCLVTIDIDIVSHLFSLYTES